MRDITDLKDVVSLIADIMTIFGLSGFLTWSFVRRGLKEQSLPEVGIGIFAYSIKTFLAVLLLAVLLIPAGFLHAFVVLVCSEGYVSEDGWWNSNKSGTYVVAYLISGLVFLPLSILTVSSIFISSLDPFRRLWNALVGRPQK